VGSSRSLQVDVRIIAATNRDLAAEIGRGGFRRDLFYRLNVVDIRVPPLRERRSDVPLLVAAFLQQIAARQGRPVPDLDPAAVAALAAHDYPGNVRELQHALERAVALARGGPIRTEHLPADLTAADAQAGAARAHDPLLPLGAAVEQFEQEYIRKALAKAGGHRGRAAALLGISRKSLWERLRDAARGSDEPA
jgi:two-component system, NtrC family, response regulator AtoC